MLLERARPTAASAPRSGSTARARRSSSAEKQNRRLRRPLPRLDPATRPRARRRPARPHVVRLAMPRDGETRRSRPAARRGHVRQRADRRPGAAQVRRLPDLPPGQRRRRSPDGDHARDPRRGVDLVDAEARAALPGVRLGGRRVHATCRSCATPTSRRSPSARTRCRSTTTATPASCPRRCSTSSALMGWSIGGDREKFTLDEMIVDASRSSGSRWAGRCSTSRS